MTGIKIVSVGNDRRVLLNGEDITQDLVDVEVSVDRFGARVILNYKCVDTSVFGGKETKVIHLCPISGKTGDE